MVAVARVDRLQNRTGVFVVAILLALAACDRRSDDELRVQSILPDESSPLSLNQSIVVRFDRAIDPLSVTRDSVRLIDEHGQVLEPERIRVREATIELVPRVPIRASLEGGTYVPGTKLRLELACYPRPDGLRSDLGELLLHAPRRSWKVVNVEERMSEGRLIFLPSSGGGAFRLVEAPRVSPDGRRIELRFDRPCYPPSVRPSSFRLIEDMANQTAIPLEVEPGGEGVMRGRLVVLKAARALSPAGGFLFFSPGQAGLLDYRLSPLSIPRDPTAFHFPGLGRSLRIRPDSTRPPREGVVEDFRERRVPVEATEDLRLPFACEGRLRWGPDGLWFPRLEWEGFRSLGDLDPPQATRDLREGATREIGVGVTRMLPESTWDFDRVEIDAEQRVYLVLPASGALRLRVAGSFRVLGDLIVRVGAAGERPSLGRRDADPRPTWNDVAGRLEIEVAGIVDVRGSIRVEPQGAGLAGWMRVPPSAGVPTDRVDLQVWSAPDESEGRFEAAPLLAGVWCAVSPWYGFGQPRSFAGLFEASSAEAHLDVFVQVRQALPSSAVRPWVRVEDLPSLGELDALRFVVGARGAGDGGLVLRSLRIR